MPGTYDTETAEQYVEYSSQFPFYRQLGERLVELVDIKEGMNVVDLGCGTGIVTRLLLERIGVPGRLIALDMSQAMLAEARRNLPDGRVKFVNASAEKLHDFVNDADVVVSNAAFWQMDQNKTLEAIWQTLSPGGCFAFNLSQGKFNFRNTDLAMPPGTFLKQGDILARMRELAEKKFDLRFKPTASSKVPDIDSIARQMHSHHFQIASHETLLLERSVTDMWAFMRIPEWTNNFEGLSYDQRMQILDETMSEFAVDSKFVSRWIFFKVTKPVDQST